MIFVIHSKQLVYRANYSL